MSTEKERSLKDKYQNDEIYSFVGKVLLAINPYKNIDQLYSDSSIKKYHSDEDLPSHIYSIAKQAFRNVLKRSQTIVIAGESGAGKTETTRHIVKFLSASGAKEKLMRILNDASTILNSFGNAKTKNNLNSSRYAKFIEIHCGKDTLTGGKIQQFMLAKTRILDFDIFGSIINATDEIKSFLKLDSNFLALKRDGRYVHTSLEDLDAAIDRVFSVAKKYELYRFISGLFCLGNIEFQAEANDRCSIASAHIINTAVELLGIDRPELEIALTTKSIKVNDETICMHLNIEQAIYARDAMIKTVYAALFEWIVQEINKNLYSGCPDTTNRSIGILDMPGFECFDVNLFEQLIINFANESIQQFCLDRVVKDDSALNNPNYADVIDLIGSPKQGILTLLDDELKLPNSGNFVVKVFQQWPSCPVLLRKKISAPREFTIRHYAKEVTYQTEHFVSANAEITSASILELSEKCLRMITDDSSFSLNHTKKPTQGAMFKQQLAKLLSTLNESESHFIKCIKPNDEQINRFDVEFVKRQLDSTGVQTLIENVSALWQPGEEGENIDTNDANDKVASNAAVDGIESDSSDDKPLAKKRRKHANDKVASNAAVDGIESDSSDDKPLAKKRRKHANDKVASNAAVDGKKRRKHRKPLVDKMDDEVLSREHVVLYDNKKSGTRCKFRKCDLTVFSYCSKCQIYLCSMRSRNCFALYHSQALSKKSK